jgi:uncharacterized protein
MKTLRLIAWVLMLASVALGKENDNASLDKYAGLYRLPGKGFVSLAVFDPGDGENRLLLTDLESGLIRCLARASGDDVFSAGPGLLTPEPVEFQIRFHRNEHGEVPSLTGDGKALPKEEARKVDAVSEEVTIHNGDIVLAGTLVKPPGEKRCPAVVFLHGSGPLNRRSFGPLPDFFLSQGFAVLTYDKRGTGGSRGKLDSATFEDLAADARAALGFLKNDPRINGHKIGLCGSSQGGFLGGLVASANPDVAFIVDYCGMFVPVWQQELFRTEAEMRGDELADADIAEALAFVKNEFEVARTGQGWEDLAKAKDKKWWKYVTKSSSLEELQFYWRTLYSYDPSVALRKVSCPVLALFGELDRSTPVSETVDNMVKALKEAGNNDFTKIVFPKAGHGLFESSRGANSEIPAAKRLAPGLFPSISDWLHREGFATP